MDIETAKKIIKEHTAQHVKFMRQCEIGKRYYMNNTDVLYGEQKKDKEDNPLRNADNRIPRNFHGLLVNQKASYAFTTPPLFDAGSKELNDTIVKGLGDDYADSCIQLCVNAANESVGWVHYWINDSGEFEWGVLDSDEIIPVYTKHLKKKLEAVLRVYQDISEAGDAITVYEIWTDKECQTYQMKSGGVLDNLNPYNVFSLEGQETNIYTHNFKEVPFIEFQNNNTHTNDLENIKRLIDVYDKVYSGFINDLDDIQELIFVLSGYGGENLNGFLQDLKKYKCIKVDADESNPGVSTLNIEIPIEARKEVLETTRKAIFEQGQGFDPQPESFGNQSGEALKFMYALLEMKTGFMEAKFRSGFAKLCRAILKASGKTCGQIIQTWTRAAIRNDKELSEICKNSIGIISTKTILKNHPFVEDVEQELKYLKQEEQEEQEEMYKTAFDGGGGNEEDT